GTVASRDAHHPPRPRAPVAARPPRRPALTPAPRAVAVAAAAAGLVATALLGLTASSAGPPLLGFAPEAAARERESEARLVASLDRERLAGWNRTLSARPHVAGTPAGGALADEIATTLRGFGLAVDVVTYRPWLSYPKKVAVSLRAPEPRVLPVREPALPEEPASGDPALTPGFVAYSASGSVEAPVVYASYGLPADYDALAARGVPVKGAIVLARYGKVHRAVKVEAAEKSGALGILIYSDPADDGFAQGDAWPRGPWRANGMLQPGNAEYSPLWRRDPPT